MYCNSRLIPKPHGQIALWLNPEFTWDANDGNRTVEHFSIKDGWNPQDTVKEFNLKFNEIEKAKN